MKRGSTDTERWAGRLTAAILVSFALHSTPFLVARRLGLAKPLDIEMRVHTVEIGLESAHAGAPQTPAQPQPPRPPLPEHHDPPRPAQPVRAREQTDTVGTTTPRATHTAANHATPRDAGGPAPRDTLPSIASAAGDLAPMVPRGALITILVRSDHIRRDPNAAAVGHLLAAIPDWDAFLGGTQLDPIRDLDTLMLAAANPFGADGHAPDWFVLAKGAHGSNAAMRRAVEAMADQGESSSSPAPSPVHLPSLDAGADEQATSASTTDAGRNIWRTEGDGVEVADIERYGARRSFVMMGNDMAAIALPGQVSALMAVLARRNGELVPSDDPAMALLIEGEGLRNLIAFNTWRGPFPIPSRAALGIVQQLDDGEPNGAVEVRSTWQYDNAAEADHAREMFEYSRGRWHILIAEHLGSAGGLNRLFAGAVARMVGVDIGALESGIDALRFGTEGDKLTIRGSLSAEQIRAVLNLAAIGGH